MTLSLLLVIALIYGLFYLLKKISGRNETSSSAMKVLDHCLLNGDAGLHLVEIGSRLFIVGSGSTKLLFEVTEKESMDELRLAVSGKNAGKENGNFADTIRRIFVNKMNLPGYKETLAKETSAGEALAGETFAGKEFSAADRKNRLEKL